ncbi:Gfo/Idh/MocA family oxidoreductase [Arthrobacter sp. AZCC_0090]|uniref:Gfo/Idh/MocA family protein n=1 Tax=Arthrobacter sp. AZCC_0090 TaxID=2735881 RepID=UPI00180D6AB7|nr:Gfo/Idh/MocA family oxidoreductase [Arthrobacter sp. AZCC_0090]MBB6406377.1 putative dehydrogenase [Arthrobacter sp. AZCC_0090]
MNQGVHTVDLLVAALGKPVSVFAYTGRLAHENIEVEDVAVAVVKFENGALGVLHASTAAFPGLSARLQVHGDKGSVVIEGDRLTFVHTTPGQAERVRLPLRDGVEANQLNRYKLADGSLASAGMNPGELSDAHRYQYGDFLNALGGGTGVRVGLTVNRQSISVILGAYESARTGMEIFLD